MNARQKAKKYKMAYELLLREKPHIEKSESEE